MKKVIVVIPTHKADPTLNELASYKQCYKILGKHPIRVVAPVGLDMSLYKSVVPETEVIFIDALWFSSIEQYNKLKISLNFYTLFRDYEFLLTYELDAWVFRDELSYWCDKGYDYIGAPWFIGFDNPNWNGKENYGLTMSDGSDNSVLIRIIGVGNSGFSLRNINRSLKILKLVEFIKSFRKIWFHTKMQAIIPFEKILRRFPFIKSKTNFEHLRKIYKEGYEFNEDYFWGIIVPSIFANFKFAIYKDAISFSFEMRPSYLYEKNQFQLPFGCHAWEKYEPKYWANYIKI